MFTVLIKSAMKSSINFSRFGIFAVLFALVLSVSAVSAQRQEPDTARPRLPDITLSTIGGEKWTLYENRGGVVLLNFWATWCEPCRTETPMLVKLADEYKESGLKVFGVALDENNSALVKKFAAEYKINYPILVPEAGSPFFKMEEVPTTLLIDADGRLIKRYTGAMPESVLRDDLSKELKKSDKFGEPK